MAKVHGNKHPELIEIETLFTASAQELLSHMKNEEMILFPYVRTMESKLNPKQAHFGSIQNPIKMMMYEHNTEGERFRKFAKLSNNYTPPEDACATYKVAYELLNEFEDDLHLHIHL